METSLFRTGQALCLLLAIFTSGVMGADEMNGSLRVGAASVTITPEPGIFLGGYDYNRRATGTHDDLYAKAVVFENGETALALVVLDALSIQPFITQPIAKDASAKVNSPLLAPTNVIVQATHTHAAPDLTGIYGPDPTHSGLDMGYVNRVISAASDAVKSAWENRVPSSLYWRQAECRGWVDNDSEPDILEPSVTVLEVRNEQGKTVATLTNFAAHPTVLDGDNTLISADWVWGFYTAMSRSLPGEHLFLQGAIGAWIQPKTPDHTFERCAKYGESLAAAVLGAQPRPLEGTRIAVRRQAVKLPLRNETFRQMTQLGLSPRDLSGETVETEVAWFRIGDAEFATHPGETAPEFAEATRKMMRTSGPKFILGLGLDHLGYIVPVRYFDRTSEIKFADYLISMSPGRDAGEVMLAALKQVVGEN